MGMSANFKQNAISTQLILESLRHDHEQALKALRTFCDAQTNNSAEQLPIESEKIFNAEKIPLIESALSKIQMGLDDSEVLITFSKYIDRLEAEHVKLQLHGQRMNEETTWLRQELKRTQQKLEESEAMLAQTCVEKNHLEFMLELRRFEDPYTENIDSNYSDRFRSNKFDDYELRNISDPTYHPTMAASVLGLTTVPPIYDSSQPKSNIDALLTSPRRPSTARILPLVTSNHLDSNSTTTSMMGLSMETSNCVLNPFSNVAVAGGGRLPSSHASYTSSFLSVVDPSSSASIPPRLRTLHRLVIQYTSQGKHEVAASLCLQTISDLEQSGGRDQPEIAALLNILALVYRDQGKYKEASELLADVIIIREKTLGPDHPLVAATLNNLAVLYAKAGRFDEAEPLCRRALTIREKVLGCDHPDVAKQLNNLALLCQSQGRFEDVETCFKRSLDIYMKNHKPWTPIVLKAKNNLASAYLKRGCLTDAEILLKDVLTPHSPAQSPTSIVSSQSVGMSVDTTVVDSAVSSMAGSSSFGDSNSHQQTSTLLPAPLWLIAEQACRTLSTNGSGHSIASSPPLSKFNVTSWAMEAHIDLSIVQSAVRNLVIVYQRQGRQAVANLVRVWSQLPAGSTAPMTTTGDRNSTIHSLTPAWQAGSRLKTAPKVAAANQ